MIKLHPLVRLNHLTEPFGWPAGLGWGSLLWRFGLVRLFVAAATLVVLAPFAGSVAARIAF